MHGRGALLWGGAFAPEEKRGCMHKGRCVWYKKEGGGSAAWQQASTSVAVVASTMKGHKDPARPAPCGVCLCATEDAEKGHTGGAPSV